MVDQHGIVVYHIQTPRKHESKFAPGPDTQQSEEVQSRLAKLLSCCEASNYLLSNSMQHHIENCTNLAILQISLTNASSGIIMLRALIRNT